MKEWQSQMMSAVGLVSIGVGVWLALGGIGLIAFGLLTILVDGYIESTGVTVDESDSAPGPSGVGVLPHKQHAVHSAKAGPDDHIPAG